MLAIRVEHAWLWYLISSLLPKGNKSQIRMITWPEVNNSGLTEQCASKSNVAELRPGIVTK